MPEMAARSLCYQIHVSYFNVPLNLVSVTVWVRKYLQNFYIFSLKKIPLLNVNIIASLEHPYFWSNLFGFSIQIVFHSYWHQHSRSAYHMHERRAACRDLTFVGWRCKMADVNRRLSAEYSDSILHVDVTGVLIVLRQWHLFSHFLICQSVCTCFAAVRYVVRATEWWRLSKLLQQ